MRLDGKRSFEGDKEDTFGIWSFEPNPLTLFRPRLGLVRRRNEESGNKIQKNIYNFRDVKHATLFSSIHFV